MTEKEVEKAYKKMTESDAPDLWAKIESNLPEKEVRTEKKVRTGFFAKLGKIFSGGSMEMDLTQTSYSTVPSIDIELGDGASDHSAATLDQLGNGLVAGVDQYFGN